MKRILLLTILLVSAFNMYAQNVGRRDEGRVSRRAAVATIKIRLSTNQPLAVSIDDRYYDKRGASLTIGEVPAGRHYLKVYNYRVGRGGNRRANVVYSGYIDLRPGTFNAALVDPYQRKMTMRTTQTFEQNNTDTYENWNDRDNRDYNDNRDNNWDNSAALRNQDVTDLGGRVNDRMSDGDKLKLMQSVLSNKTYYTDQLRTMFSWLSFESTKLDFAKWAYDNTIDKENYWKLEDVFSFSSSKDDLTSYIDSKKVRLPVNDRNDRYNDNGRNDNYDDNSSYNPPNNHVMSDQGIADLGSRVKDRSGDDAKLKLIQSVLEGTEYYTEQVRTMLGWLSFTDTKMQLAKLAYHNTIDKQNYWKLEDEFSFSSSKDELNDFIQANSRKR